jgi:creatinine amidohydrolase/Fe(II)-dependent formamide hydrolase-like protein
MDKKKFLLKNLTWPEIRQKMTEGYDTVIINLASVEQHGPHLPESTDEIIGQGLSCGLAEKLGNAFVAPSVIPGMSNHHLPLPGSLSLRPEIFRGIVEDYVSCYIRHGFKRLVLLPSHGGNMDMSAELVSTFNKQYPDVKFYSALTLDMFMKLLAGFEKEYNMPTGSCGGHACAFETSVMLYLAPELVKMEKAKPGFVGTLTRDVTDRLFKYGVVGLSEIGVLGDPTQATAELGEKFYHKTVEEIERYVREQIASR